MSGPESCFFPFEFFHVGAFDLCICVSMEGIIEELPYSKGVIPHCCGEFGAPFLGAEVNLFRADVRGGELMPLV
jgi:hypothetical protein